MDFLTSSMLAWLRSSAEFTESVAPLTASPSVRTLPAVSRSASPTPAVAETESLAPDVPLPRSAVVESRMLAKLRVFAAVSVRLAWASPTAPLSLSVNSTSLSSSR